MRERTDIQTDTLIAMLGTLYDGELIRTAIQMRTRVQFCPDIAVLAAAAVEATDDGLF